MPLSDLVERVRSGRATICVLGLGRIGLPLGVVLANSGFSVVGVDIDRGRVAKVSEGRAPFKEEGLEAALRKALGSGRFEATADSRGGVARADVVMVTVGTPLAPQLLADYSQLHAALEEVLSEGISMKAIGLRSTLFPGTVDNIVIPYLEGRSGLKAGEDFALAMIPERILEGKAIEELYSLPEIVGGVNDVSNAIFGELFRRINPRKAILHTSPRGAELAKLFTNIYRYVNFALANEFAIWAEMYGEDAHEIIEIANYEYPRGRIPRPGLAGGPCLGKDGLLLDNNTTFSSIVSIAWKLNEAVPQYIVESIRRRVGRLYGRRVAVLGLAFKAGSDDTRLSPSVKLVEILKGHGAEVLVHDPYLADTMALDEVLRDPEIVVVSVNHPGFDRLAERIDESGCGLVYDVWGIFDPADFKRASYMRFGRGK